MHASRPHPHHTKTHTAPNAGKSRGYGFIEYEDKKDMKEAYKAADGRKIEGRRVLVDVERGRTVESWWVAAPCVGGRWRHASLRPGKYAGACTLRSAVPSLLPGTGLLCDAQAKRSCSQGVMSAHLLLPWWCVAEV